MPTYNYRCPTCGMTFEATNTIRKRASTRCPKCGSASQKEFTPSRVVVPCFIPFRAQHLEKCRAPWVKSVRHYKDLVKQRNERHPDDPVVVPALE